MGLSKTEVNLRRLLSTAPWQQNHAKLIHYVTTLREQLEQLAEETAPVGLPRISKTMLNEYSEKIESLAAQLSYLPRSLTVTDGTSIERGPSKTVEGTHIPSSRLRRRFVPYTNVDGRPHEIPEIAETNPSIPVELDESTLAHIETQRKLQEDMTSEIVGLARQLKESSLKMNKSLQDTEKILDSTERALEHSLLNTVNTNTRAMEIYTESIKTSCFTWLVIFVMTCIFFIVILLIRIT